MSYYLGIDLGTSATKVIVLGEKGEVVARARVAHGTSRRCVPGRVDTQAWQSSIKEALSQVAGFFPSLSGLGIDVHCPVVIPLSEGGEAVGLGVTWDNPALRDYFQEYSPRRSHQALAATGNHASQSTFVGVVYPYLRECDPDVFQRMDCFGFAGTWLGAQLTGELALDPTQASYSGLYDTMGYGKAWVPETLDLLGITRESLPPLRDPLDILGTVTAGASRAYGLPEGIPVAVGAADTPAAAFALGTRPGEAPFFILGTTHVINACLERPDERATALQRRGVRAGEWLINGVSNGGDALAAGAVMAGFTSVEEMINCAFDADEDQIRQAPFFVPHVMKERGPLWFEEPCSLITDITRDLTRQQLAWSIVEGVLMIDRMILEACVSPRLRTVFVTGAFGCDERLPQLMADLFSVRLHLVEESSLPAIGAAGMCRESVEGLPLPEVDFREVLPRDTYREFLDRRWGRYLHQWEATTGRSALEPLR